MQSPDYPRDPMSKCISRCFNNNLDYFILQKPSRRKSLELYDVLCRNVEKKAYSIYVIVNILLENANAI